jgi:hypothetical protein
VAPLRGARPLFLEEEQMDDLDAYSLSMQLSLEILSAKISNADWLASLTTKVNSIGAVLRSYRHEASVIETSIELTPTGKAARKRALGLETLAHLKAYEQDIIGYVDHLAQIKAAAPKAKAPTDVERLTELILAQEIRAGLADRDPLDLSADYREWAQDHTGPPGAQRSFFTVRRMVMPHP